MMREPGRKSVALKNGSTFNLTWNGISRALVHMDARNGAVREARVDFIRNVVDFAESAIDFYEENRDGLNLLTLAGRGVYKGRNYYGTVTLQQEEDGTYSLRDVNAVLRDHASGHRGGHGGTVSYPDSSRATNTRDSADSASVNRRPLGRVNTRMLLQWVLENQAKSPDAFREHFFGSSPGVNRNLRKAVSGLYTGSVDTGLREARRRKNGAGQRVQTATQGIQGQPTNTPSNRAPLPIGSNAGQKLGALAGMIAQNGARSPGQFLLDIPHFLKRNGAEARKQELPRRCASEMWLSLR